MPAQDTPIRKYAFVKIDAGDYLLPGNDEQTLWRIHRYTDGPSEGLDWPRDRMVWGLWRCPVSTAMADGADPVSWDHPWEHCASTLETRDAAIREALRLAPGSAS